MTFLIILFALIFIVYIISFTNRDKSQDYKIQNHRLHVSLSEEDKIRIDLTTDLDAGIAEILKSTNPALSKTQISDFLLETENQWLAKMNKVAAKYNVPMYKVEDIINECMDKAYKKYYQ